MVVLTLLNPLLLVLVTLFHWLKPNHRHFSTIGLTFLKGPEIGGELDFTYRIELGRPPCFA
jgi:hypothetical protein